MINLLLYLYVGVNLINLFGKPSHIEVMGSFVPYHDSSGRFPGYSNKDEYDQSEEEDCPRGSFYHIRGRRCVPYQCIGGSKFRNKNTGECIVRKEYHYNFLDATTKNFRRFLPRTIQKPRSRFRFALPNKVKG